MELQTCRTFLTSAVFSLTLLPALAGDTLVQVSTIDALVQGIYDGGVTIDELKKSGDFGIGTLDDLDGEMLAMDGIFYQITSDGKVHIVPDKAETPFSAVSFFKPDLEIVLSPTSSLAALQSQLDQKLPSTNLFYAFRITGVFSSISLRSVPKQAPPYPALTEVVKHQARFDLKNCSGTLIGFRCPTFVKGVNVPGYHFHFISDDRKSGGHLLECALESGTAQIDTLENFKILLPRDPAFLKADFTHHDEQSVEAVEKLTNTPK